MNLFKKILQSRGTYYFIIVLGFAIRLYGSLTPAQPYDIATYHAWGNHLLSVGPMSFYDNIWSDYLPLPILTFAFPAYFSQIFNLNFALIFKLLHSIIEIILIFLIGKHFTSAISSKIFVSSLLLFSPAIFGNTAFWGQVDSIPTLLTLLSFITMSPYWFGLAVAYKPIMILTAPILFIKNIKEGNWWKFTLYSSLTFLLTGLPTGGLNFFSHLWQRTVSQADTYPFLTINAWNFWSLIPVNQWIADSTSVLGISGKSLGLAIFLSLCKYCLNTWRKTSFNPIYSYRLAAIILILFYTFTTRMHERHLLFGLPFLAIAAYYQRYLVIPYTLYSILYTLNLYSAFYWVNHSQTWPFPPLATSLSSWATVLTAISLVFIWDWKKFLSSLSSHLSSNKLLFIILILASLLRFVNLSHPKAYIFDEVYHAFTAKELLHNNIAAWEWWTTPPPGVAYEWTHPPLAKYGMILGMLLFGENELGYRIPSALLGVLSILGIYYLTLSLTLSKPTALISALLLSLEGTHIAQSRIAMNDVYMLNFLIWSLYAAVKSRWKLSAVFYGLSLASKWSALYGVIPLALIYLQEYSLKLNFIAFIKYLFSCLRLLLISIFIYILSFTPFIIAGHSWEQWWELHRQMWYYHTHLVATHGYQSTPIQWIFAARPVWYWVEYGKGVISNIFVQGNPLILWLGLAALVLQINKIFLYPYSILYTLYFILTLPWVYSPRIMFYYHYLPSASFLCILLATFIIDLPKKYQLLLLFVSLISLFLISPMLYGFPMSEKFWNQLFTIFPTWK